MRLTHITIHGFKSFAKKVSIDVTHNVTGVVGPNGSGKSNIAEAIRFALGEQSMKSMRGKLGADLIFKGSNNISPMSRASVSLSIENKEKGDHSCASEDLAPYLAYDEIVLSRELFADGTSNYTLNGAKVRLKDVQELLSFAGIGASAHTIISQGESDKILLSSPKERKGAIEDALFLRVYHLRINESKRKLDKVKDSVREIELLRKEIAPHLSNLKRQVDRIENKEKEKQILFELLTTFLKKEDLELKNKKNKIEEDGSSASLKLIAESIREELKIKKTEVVSLERADFNHQKSDFYKQISEEQVKKELLSRDLGKIEMKISLLEKDLENIGVKNSFSISRDGFLNTKNKILSFIKDTEENIKNNRYEQLSVNISLIKEELFKFFDKEIILKIDEDGVKGEIANLKQEILSLEEKEKIISNKIIFLQEKIDSFEKEERNVSTNNFEEEKKLLLLEAKLREFESMILLREEEERNYSERKERFESLLAEGAVILGKNIFDYESTSTYSKYQDTDKNQILRLIERTKIKIEENSVINGLEIIKEYNSVLERENYLKKELDDIKQTEDKLIGLINDLSKSLEGKFEDGVKKINEAFSQFFKEIFSGGNANLSVVYNIRSDDDGEEVREQGIEIEVSLPSKKVRELAMFFGGEKTLTAIALLFAMSSITPPPFMILDETDAPLDESNAKKYGSMMKRLAEKSKLFVITHNREAMGHCDMLYGVTLGSDGASKLLSIDLWELKIE